MIHMFSHFKQLKFYSAKLLLLFFINYYTKLSKYNAGSEKRQYHFPKPAQNKTGGKQL